MRPRDVAGIGVFFLSVCVCMLIAAYLGHETKIYRASAPAIVWGSGSVTTTGPVTWDPRSITTTGPGTLPHPDFARGDCFKMITDILAAPIACPKEE
jgi:hypothetical protein